MAKDIKSKSLEKKYNKLLDMLKSFESAGIAFSGGIDSTFLLFAAKNALGKKVEAFTVSSIVFPESEKIIAQKITGQLDVKHEIVDIDLTLNDEFLRNDRQRCYYCKKSMLGVLKTLSDRRGLKFLLEGANADDILDYRPGMKAVEELKVKSPLKEAGFTKAEIINLSKKFNIFDENRGSFSCLATRIAYGININQEILQKVKLLEDYLSSIGFTKLRVRHHGDIARIEIEVKDFTKIIKNDLRQEIVNKFYASGYKYVVLDMEGFLSGSMNK
jgi:uncharacterized protein